MDRNFLVEIINKEVLTGAEVASILGVTRQQVANLVKQQELVPVKITSNGNIFLKMDVDDFVKKRNSISSTIQRKQIIGCGITRKCIEYIENNVKNTEDVIAIFIYFNSGDALDDNYYTTREEMKCDTLMHIETPTFVIKFSDLSELWFDGLNCGYGGTGPNGSFRILTEIFNIPSEIARLVYDSSWIKLYKEFGEWNEIHEPVDGGDGKEQNEFGEMRYSDGHCYLFNNNLVLVPEKMDRYWLQGNSTDFLTQHISFVQNPRSVTIYSREMALRTGHYIYSTVSGDVFQVIIKDLSGRELWLNCYVDEKVSIDRQSDIMEVLKALEFDIVPGKTNNRLMDFINSVLREKILVENYITLSKESSEVNRIKYK